MKNKIEIIAEIANAHQGNPEEAIKLAEAAFKAGADAVKFQVYSAEELLVRKHPRFEHFKKQAFSHDAWKKIFSKAARDGRRIYCDVFGLESLKVASGADIYGYKVHSSDLGNLPLIQALAETNKRVLLATGGSTAREIGKAVSIFITKKSSDIVLLHGFQGYPTTVEDACLSRLTWLRETFGKGIEIGYSDHAAGDSQFATILPFMALAMGATVLEKHITLDRSAGGIDYYSSFNPDEFADFVNKLNEAKSAIGDNPKIFTASEQKYRKDVKKYWISARPLKAATRIKESDITMKRVASDDIYPLGLDKIIGHTLLCDCPDEHLLTKKELSHTVWALVVARMRSERLPSKALLDVGGMPALQHLFERLKQARNIDKIMFCTTKEAEDDVLVALAKNSGIEYFRGPTEDVLGRMVGAIEGHNVDIVLRVTGDDILIDPDYVDRAIDHHLSVNAEYSDLHSLPSGTEVEVFDAALLKDIWKAAKDKMGTEYLTTYITNNIDQFFTSKVPVDKPHALPWRLTLDTPEDYKVIKTFLDAMKAKGKTFAYRLNDIVDFFSKHPEILAVNSATPRGKTHVKISTELEWMRYNL